jgi:hypothetical protein
MTPSPSGLPVAGDARASGTGITARWDARGRLRLTAEPSSVRVGVAPRGWAA